MKDTVYYRGAWRRLWWIPLFTGLVSIGFGIWCMLSPESSLEVFAYVFAGAMCAAGLFNFLFAGVGSKLGTGWGWSVALGILELIAGIWLFMLPAPVLVQTFIFVIGIWILVAAINSVCEAGMLSAVSPLMTVWMVILLIATIFFAIIFLSNPIVGGIAVWLWIGISLITFGFYRVFLAFQIKRIGRA